MSDPRARLARQIRLLADAHATERDAEVLRAVTGLHDVARVLEAAGPAEDRPRRAERVTSEAPSLRCQARSGAHQCDGAAGHEGDSHWHDVGAGVVGWPAGGSILSPSAGEDW